jgi:NTP pyrophosphatase (non-canonical NTP hydrolase)
MQPESSADTDTNGATDLIALRDAVRVMVDENGWARLDTPKNLVMALSVEVAELMEPFQWLEKGSLEELGDRSHYVRLEMADVLIYLLALADKLEIDLRSAVLHKIEIKRNKS